TNQLFVATCALYLPFCATALAYRVLHPKKPLSVRNLPRSNIVFTRNTAMIACVAIGLIILLTYSSSMTLSFTELYVRRMAMRDEMPSRSGIAYVVAMYTSALIPICLALSFGQKIKKLAFSAALFGSLIVFSLQGTK